MGVGWGFFGWGCLAVFFFYGFLVLGFSRLRVLVVIMFVVTWVLAWFMFFRVLLWFNRGLAVGLLV